jgi:FkbM family methyltransferase
MKFKLARAATFMDRYGWWAGIGIYFRLKKSKMSALRLPGIAHPFSLRDNTTDSAVFEQVFLNGEYDIDIPLFPNVIVDAGANIGLFSILMKNRFPAARIVCVEPGHENCVQLKKNLSVYENVEIICAGIWSKDTSLKISDKHNGGQTAWLTEKDATGDVSGITIDTLMKNLNLQKIDILKVDIEGSEKVVFLENYQQWLPKVKMIVIELHDWLMPGCSKPFFDAIQKSFSKYSYFIRGENTIIINHDMA